MNSYIFVWKPPNIFPDMQNSIKAHLPNSRDGRGSDFFHGAGQGSEGQGQKSTDMDELFHKLANFQEQSLIPCLANEEGTVAFYFLLHILLTGWIGHWSACNIVPSLVSSFGERGWCLSLS